MIDTFLEKLKGVRRTSRGWMALCPAHPDKTQSLSVAASEGGKILIRCFAGCETADVLAGMGLTMADLFTDREPRPRYRRKAEVTPKWNLEQHWRQVTSDLLFSAEGLRLRAERILQAARGMDTAEWSNQDRDEAMNPISNAYMDLVRVDVLEDVAFRLRLPRIRYDVKTDDDRPKAWCRYEITQTDGAGRVIDVRRIIEYKEVACAS